MKCNGLAPMVNAYASIDPVFSLRMHTFRGGLAHVPDDNWTAVIKNIGSLEDFRNEVLFTFDSILSNVPTARPASV